MKHFNQERDNLISAVCTELKNLGVKKLKKLKTNILKPEKCVHEADGKIFGTNLNEQEWILDGEHSLPRFVAMSTAYLQNFSSEEVGIFRKAGNVARQKKIRARLEQGGNLENCEPNDVASLLKQWLRELSEPLIPASLQDLFIRCLQLDSDHNRVTACLLACLLLLPDHLYTLKHLLCFMSNIASNSDKNKMGVYNLALIMAPNLFVTTESSDKIKNEVVQQQTAVVKLLIENCDKIGKVPDGISFNCMSLCSDLDSSSDFLDSNLNKLKKRRRSGGAVQDIVSGIKRLVGQNNTPASRNATPENVLKTSVPRFASKRKADPDLPSLSPIKKKNLSLEDLNKVSTTTPNYRGLVPEQTEKNIGGHVRRKSIGALLRRKDRKRSKSSKMPSESLELKCLPNDFQSIDKLEKVNVSNKVHKETNINLPNEEKNLLKRSGSIKKSTSDRHLRGNNSDFSMLTKKTISASQGSLPLQALIESPYKLRPKITENAMFKTVVEEKRNIQNSIEINDYSAYVNEISTHLKPKENKKLNLGSEVTFHYDDIVCRRSPRLSAAHQNVENNVDCHNSFNRKRPSSSKLSSGNRNETRSVKLGLTRQEGFIVKNRKRKSKSSSLKIKGEEKKDINGLISKSENLVTNSTKDLKYISDIKSRHKSSERRRRTRHGSLIRGKPNSVQSGLRSALPRHCSHDSALKLNSPHMDALCYDENSLIGSPVLQNLDLSLSILLQNFCLSSPTDSSGLKLDLGISSNEDVSTLNLNISENETNVGENRVSSIPLEISENGTPQLRNRLSNNSNVDHPDLYYSSGLDRTNSFSGREVKYRRKSPRTKQLSPDLSQSHSVLFSPLNSESNTSLTLPEAGQKLDESCFKTPNNKYPNSPDSANWMSGSAFLSTLASPHEEIINKRESIAMILKNNTGHVQAKVSMYDNNFHHRNSSSTSKNCYPDEKSLRSSSQKCYSANRLNVENSRSTDSAHKNSSVKSRTRLQRSPLPLPPKFTLADFSTPSPKVSHPLKEVTNLNLEDSKSPSSFPKTVTPVKELNGSQELKKNTSKSTSNPKRLLRNSFSGHTPYKLSKKVLRSESSPACHRKKIVLHE